MVTKSTQSKSTENQPTKAKKTAESTAVKAEVVSSKSHSNSKESGSSKQSALGGLDNKTLILLAHILGLVTSFIAALIVYLVSEDTLVKKHAAAALNFQISLIVYATIFTVVGGFLTVITLGLFGLLMIPLSFVLMAYAIIPPIIATIRANEDIKNVYNYPLVINFIS